LLKHKIAYNYIKEKQKSVERVLEMPCDKVFLLIDEILSSRILLVQRKALPGYGLTSLLAREGFEFVEVVDSVSNAITMVAGAHEEDDSDVDLIIYSVDKFDPANSEDIWQAKEACEALNVPLVILGEENCSEELVELVETGCVDFIKIPFADLNLIARLKTLLNLRQTNRKLKRHQRELKEITKELEEKNEKLNSILADIRFDLSLAGELQRSFLPAKNVNCDSMEFAYYYKPCETIGGDLINIVPVTSRYFVIYLLDVSGHGVSAALLAFAIHRYLSSESNQGLIKKTNGKLRCPADVLRNLNKDFLARNEWFKYFTITYGIYDARVRTFRYCRAGQTPLLLIKKNSDPQFLRKGCPPVGLAPNITYYEDKLQLSPGDRIYLYSDGITEARNQQKELFGEERLLSILKNPKSVDLQKHIDKVIDRFFAWCRNTAPRDDIALLAMLVK
jgi:sigma-B regulation protein RsbU (phosphoserine phosphatase)